MPKSDMYGRQAYKRNQRTHPHSRFLKSESAEEVRDRRRQEREQAMTANSEHWAFSILPQWSTLYVKRF